eukprot:3353731-Rhodomonas_salina.1
MSCVMHTAGYVGIPTAIPRVHVYCSTRTATRQRSSELNPHARRESRVASVASRQPHRHCSDFGAGAPAVQKNAKHQAHRGVAPFVWDSACCARTVHLRRKLATRSFPHSALC